MQGHCKFVVIQNGAVKRKGYGCEFKQIVKAFGMCFGSQWCFAICQKRLNLLALLFLRLFQGIDARGLVAVVWGG